MKISDVRERAKALGLEKVGKMRKEELICRIQRAEGNTECFGSTDRQHCTQAQCCWREDCLGCRP